VLNGNYGRTVRWGSTTTIIQRRPTSAVDQVAAVGADIGGDNISSNNETGMNMPKEQDATATATSDSTQNGNDTHLFSEPTESIVVEEHEAKPANDWMTSFHGVGGQAFSQRIIDILLAPVNEADIEIKPDGLIYLPEIKYRRILNRSFGPGAWGLVPRGPHSVTGNTLSREYALFCLSRFVSQARGEQDFFDEAGVATATEGVKSNALMRCCKDLGIASELWDPAFITAFKSKYCVEEWVTHVTKGTKKRMWRLKTRKWEYPWVKR
ncbi:hypothetical protein EV182_003649, partial [Spiromyces aspiralis]